MVEPITLAEAQRRIHQWVRPTGCVRLPLIEAACRIASTPIYARQDSPPFAKSAYDGYAVASTAADDSRKELSFTITGEIAAGESARARIKRGTACRIMTGAPVPPGTWKVIPQEKCFVSGGLLSFSAAVLLRGPSGIQKKGLHIRKGSLLADKGTSLQPAHLGLIAESGIGEVEVHRRPTVGVFSSGSELVAGPERRRGAETVSSNRFLLAGLVEESGCRLRDYGIIADDTTALCRMLQKVRDEGVDLLISTGGTGPGKYDLLKESLLHEGGRLIFSSLRLRPGKSAFSGIFGTTIHFGLPGPPAAVQPLFQVLILPALRAMQGLRRWQIPRLKARLSDDVDLGRSGPMLLREGMLAFANGDCLVRLCAKSESANCYLLCPPGRRRLPAGMMLNVIPISGCRFSTWM